MFKRNKAQIISDAICGILMLASVLVLLLVGIFAEVWHPTWVIVPSSGLLCGIISIIVNTISKLSKKNNEEEVVEKKKK